VARICSVKNCKNVHRAKGYCSPHYKRLMRYGDPLHFPSPEETRKKLSESHKGQRRSVSEETKKKMSVIMKGKVPWNKGKTGVYSEASIKKMKGRVVSEETKKQMSAYAKNRTIEHKMKIVKARKGFKHSKETKKKISLTNTGKKRSEEQIKQMSETRLTQKFPIKDTKLEIVAQTILRDNNIKFIDHKAILGQPDIFIEPNFCIFMDGDYFHGNPDMYEDDYVIWKAYDKGNIHRPKVTAKSKREKDHKINLKLKSQGYRVMRTYETPFYENPKKWLTEVKEFIKNT
jgi:hypothetical protein